MEITKDALSSDIIITDDKQYAVGLLYNKSVYDVPIISIKINGSNLNESLQYFKSFNISIFYNHFLAKDMNERYDLGDLLAETDYSVIVKMYRATPKFQPFLQN